MVCAGLVAVVLVVLRGASDMVIGDAQMYWEGARALVSGADVFVAGGLELRGALTPVVYLPSALIAELWGGQAGYTAILVQNGLMIAALGAVLVPLAARELTAQKVWWPWLSAVPLAVLAGGFAPFALLDLWTMLVVLLAFVVGRRGKWWNAAFAGVLLGIAINLRPAYVIPALLMVATLVLVHWSKALIAAAGVAVGLLPQVVVNLIIAGTARPWPINTVAITKIQSQYAAFTVRYDTVPAQSDLRQFYCSPQYASVTKDAIPSGAGELALSFLSHPFESVPFMAQKVASTLLWSRDVPYSQPGVAFDLTAVGVLLIAAIGVVGIIGAIVVNRGRTSASWSLGALWFGSLLAVVFSAPEARFAVPFLVLGLVGVLWQASQPLRIQPFRLVVGVVLAISLAAIGIAGLQNPAPPGDVTVVLCAEQ